MTRRRKAKPHLLYAEAVLRCDGCGGDLGSAYQFRDQHPRAGESAVDARVGKLVASPHGGLKLLCNPCPRCHRAVPHRQWSYVVSHLDGIDETGSYRKVLCM